MSEPTVAEGRVLHFVLEEEIGSGGTGVVFRARDEVLGRRVALKFLRPELASEPSFSERLLREARIASALDHPNLCTVYSIERAPDGRPFLVLAYYAGSTVAELLAGGPLPTAEALEIGRQVAAGLGAAHHHGIVHRDVKPSNLLRTDDGTVKILDFGLAQSWRSVTRRGQIAGTVEYMSPEQARGEPVDGRSDLFSLGVVLHHMLAGRTPFRRARAEETIRAIRAAPPEPLRTLRRDIPVEVERTLARALEKVPQHRYQTAADFMAALDYAARSSGWAAYDEPAAGAWQASLAVLPFRDATEHGDHRPFCDGMTEQLIARLTRLPGLKVISRASVAAAGRRRNESPAELGAALGVRHLLDGCIERSGDRIRLTAHLLEASSGAQVWARTYRRNGSDLLTLQEELAARIADSLRLEIPPPRPSAAARRSAHAAAFEAAMTAMSHTNQFFFSFDPAELAEALRLGARAVELDPEHVTGHVAISYTHAIRYYLARRPEDLEACRRAAETAYRLEPESSSALAAIGGLRYLEGNGDDAVARLRAALERDPNNALAMHLLARSYAQLLGLHGAALRLYSRVIELDPLYAFPYHNRGYSYLCVGHYAAAERDLRRALELQANDHQALAYLTELLALRGELDEARDAAARLAGLPLRDRMPLALVRALDGDRGALELDRGPEVLAALGDRTAIAALAEARRAGRLDALKLSTSPLYDRFRADPEFREVLALGLQDLRDSRARHGVELLELRATQGAATPHRAEDGDTLPLSHAPGERLLAATLPRPRRPGCHAG
ncbi:MAG TPA: protein kinase [Thermoanaerobaculia bacterium]|nr:protein kinase [Thermoanaerobaculia bacterium]